MKEHEEKEYKVMLSEKQFQRLCDLLGNPRPVKQENRYYDTEDWKIRRQYGSMRIRTINNKHIFTLKIRKNSDTVMEYELPVSENSLFALYNPQVQALLKEHQITEALQEIGRLTTWKAKMITEDAEICLDYNEYREQYDYEVEYEYLRPHDGLKVFQQLLEQIGASYEGNCRSKVMRAVGTPWMNK